jgi:predicted Zn-dependent protease
MAQLAHITIQQAIQLANRQYADGSYFNPIQVGELWYISAEEVRDCVTIEWVKDLDVTEVEIPVTDLELP